MLVWNTETRNREHENYHTRPSDLPSLLWCVSPFPFFSDIEFSEPSRILSLCGAELLLVPTALSVGGVHETVPLKVVPTRAADNHVREKERNKAQCQQRVTALYTNRACHSACPLSSLIQVWIAYSNHVGPSLTGAPFCGLSSDQTTQTPRATTHTHIKQHADHAALSLSHRPPSSSFSSSAV